MRTLVTTFLVGICLAASPALAQQHPWVPSDVYTGSVQSGDWYARAYGRVHRGDSVAPAVRPGGKAATDELYDDACHSGHAVFSCPGTM